MDHCGGPSAGLWGSGVLVCNTTMRVWPTGVLDMRLLPLTMRHCKLRTDATESVTNVAAATAAELVASPVLLFFSLIRRLGLQAASI